jgi:hypothetical protein
VSDENCGQCGNMYYGYCDTEVLVCMGDSTDALCSGGIDNDGDSYLDCDDYNCSMNAQVTVQLSGQEPVEGCTPVSRPASDRDCRSENGSLAHVGDDCIVLELRGKSAPALALRFAAVCPRGVGDPVRSMASGDRVQRHTPRVYVHHRGGEEERVYAATSLP